MTKMHGTLFISFDENIKEPDYSFEIGLEEDEYNLTLTINPTQPLEEALTYSESLNNNLKKEINILKEVLKDYKDNPEMYNNLNDLIKTVNSFIKREDNILDSIKYVRFIENLNNIDFDNDLKEEKYNYEYILEYLNRNSVIKDKKIIVGDYFELEEEPIKELRNIFKDYPNINIRLVGNTYGTSLDDCEKTIDIINSMAEKVKKHDFSPIEQIMYTYDIVRDNIYKAEDKEESQTVSRDLSNVLLGDKIVCVGFANIFDKILKKLDIKTERYGLNDQSGDGGHEINIVHIIDDKYDIDGVYYFDTTWDSKKSEEDKDYLNSYRFFAMAYKDLDIYFKKANLIDSTYPEFSNDLIWRYENIIKTQGYEKVPNDMIKTINRLSKFIDEEERISLPQNYPWMPASIAPKLEVTQEEIMKRLWKYTELMDKPITAEKLLEVLYNVRKYEYYENHEKYSFTLNTFYAAAALSGWQFNKGNKSTIYNSKKEYLEHIKKEILRYSTRTDLSKKIDQVKLTKILRNYSDSKKEF